jgi:hypothetical protein
VSSVPCKAEGEGGGLGNMFVSFASSERLAGDLECRVEREFLRL